MPVYFGGYALVFLAIWLGRDFGPMLAAERRSGAMTGPGSLTANSGLGRPRVLLALIPLALLGLLWVRLNPPECLWIYLFLGSVNLVYSLVLTMLRYRLSLMPWVILLASVALCRLAERVFRRAA